ncbi:hypothetical protein KEM48_007202 [Puccinia striiformis f. sp. tritici PST-130]|nr:hypothetical protein KEM48_007202 [Puccinia striiformis f. sp. tritici PST-130]
MDAFCSNTLSQTQCNGLTRIEFSSIVSVGIVQGFSGLILAGYLTFICQRQASSSAWILALTGILYLITTSLEAASRFVPGSLTQFLSMEKATADNLSPLPPPHTPIISWSGQRDFDFVLFLSCGFCDRPDEALRSEGGTNRCSYLDFVGGRGACFNILALLAISYEELPEGIRAGAPDIKNFLDPSIKAIAAMLSFMGLTAITHVSIYYLLRRRKFQHQKQKEARRRKAMSSFSNSTLEDENSIMDSKEPLRRYFDTLIPSTLLAIIKTSLTLSSENTIIARRVIGLVEYISYALVVASCLRPPQAAKVERDNFFGRITSNPSFACSAGSEEVLVPPQMPRSNSILRRAHMASIVVGSNNSTSVFPSRVQQKPRDRKPPPSQTQSKMRMSYAAQSAISSLAPEDSASTAAFLPRPPPPPPHLRTRTTHGPNGSELAPLREDLVEKFNGFQIL